MNVTGIEPMGTLFSATKTQRHKGRKNITGLTGILCDTFVPMSLSGRKLLP